MAALDWTRGYLERAGDEHARHSAEWLLEAATGLSRLELYTHFDQPLTAEERAQLREGVTRRAAGEPLQYITGVAYFRHLELKVTPAVLIPRPETEVLVDVALEELSGGATSKVLDLCAGSGCIALSLIDEAGVSVTATDLSADALAIARDNAEALGSLDWLDLRQGDLFDALNPDERFDLIVSNPPYVPEGERATMSREVTDFEPGVALFSGADGLDCFRRIVADAPRHLAANGVVIMELHTERATQAAQEAVKLKRYEAIDVLPDLAGRMRFVRLRGKTSD